MSTATISEREINVRDAVQRQLEWDPTVDASAVLAGTVSSWPQREAAEEAAAHPPGTARVDNRIVVEGRQPADEQC
jgi:osmotically-inducible protein OsmY